MSNTILNKVHSALEFEPRINLHAHPIKLSYSDDDVLSMEGDVEDIAAKKLALGLGATASGARGIVDRLHLLPSSHKGDGQIRDMICEFLLEEPVFLNCSLQYLSKGELVTLRQTNSEGGTIVVSVEDGIITLDGEVLSLSHKRLAGALTWWTPGCRDVVNGLGVFPPEEDNDQEIIEALTLILEKDPLVQAEQIRLSCKNSVVNLQGYVRTTEERKMVEMDAWYTIGVEKVINEIEIED